MQLPLSKHNGQWGFWFNTEFYVVTNIIPENKQLRLIPGLVANFLKNDGDTIYLELTLNCNKQRLVYTIEAQNATQLQLFMAQGA